MTDAPSPTPGVATDHHGSPATGTSTLRGQAVRFIVVGIASTLAYALLYLGLRAAIGAQAANFVALAATAVANTTANRRLTFGVRGRAHAGRHQAQGLLVFGACWALTSLSLTALHALSPTASHTTEVVVLCAANVAGTVLRFVLLRAWVFRRRTASPA